MSDQFNPTETKIICALIQHMKGNVNCDWDAAATVAGYSNGKSFQRQWYKLAARKNLGGAGGVGGSPTKADAGSPTKADAGSPTKAGAGSPTKAWAGKGASGGADGEEDEEESKEDGSPAKKRKTTTAVKGAAGRKGKGDGVDEKVGVKIEEEDVV